VFRKAAAEPRAELLQGTLDLLVLKAVSLGKLHGYGILLRIEQISGNSLTLEQGALYPALYRLERQGMLATEWGVSENNRKAKYYSLTSNGHARLQHEVLSWNRLVHAIGTALKADAFPA
jgi:transcriptional regulator